MAGSTRSLEAIALRFASRPARRACSPVWSDRRRFRPIAAAFAGCSCRLSDGEIAVLGADGVTSFAALQMRSRGPPSG
jgi:hypothetical protein